MRVLLVALAVVSVLTLPLEAQRNRREPRRPRLSSTADTNDVNAYLNHGARTVEDNATTAAEAYYWAMRLDPGNADALYGLRTARLMQRQSVFLRYMQGDERTVFSDEMQSNDSLYFKALQLDPFLHEQHARTVLFNYYRKAIASGINQGEIDHYVNQRLDASPPSTRARMAAAQGQVVLADQLYSEAIGQARNPSYLYIERGRLNAISGRIDEAVFDFTSALERLSRDEEKKERQVIFYSSKALHEHSLGLLYARKGDAEKAREAFGRAMTEDLSFHPAHVELSRLALAAKDTVTALSEMALAVELAPADAFVHFLQGELLLQVGQAAEAMEPLKKAIDLEPYYAAPQFALAAALEKSGDTAAAKAAYEKFLAMAARRHPQRQAATTRLRAIGGGQ